MASFLSVVDGLFSCMAGLFLDNFKEFSGTGFLLGLGEIWRERDLSLKIAPVITHFLVKYSPILC